ncbi:ATP-binding protein [bacterium]|nr:ATP-binding protein [bacterium]
MKISPITQYKPTFGYDKKLNRELKAAIRETSDKEFSYSIAALNNYCNNLETSIREIDKQSKEEKPKHYDDIVDIFLNCKDTLTGYISVAYEQLNFADREYLHYNNEFIQNGSDPKDWRSELLDRLSEWTQTKYYKNKVTKPKDAGKEPYVPKFDEEGREITGDNDSKKAELQKRAKELASKSFLEEFKPTAQTPKGFKDVAGMTELKDKLENGIIEYINNPEQAQLDFEEYGKTIPKSILLYGPPGCGKTYITQALASEVQTPLYLLNLSKTGSHYINMTSKNIKEAFDEAAKIAEKSDKPCLVFMDEVDSFGFDRTSRTENEDVKQVATLLQSLDSVKDANVIIIGATNKYNLLDPAVKRRFTSKVFVDVPEKDAITDLLSKKLSKYSKGHKLLEDKEQIDSIAHKLQGYSNDSICKITDDAAMNALKRNRAEISLQDFEKAIKETSEEKPDRKEYIADSKKIQNKIGFGS